MFDSSTGHRQFSSNHIEKKGENTMLDVVCMYNIRMDCVKTRAKTNVIRIKCHSASRIRRFLEVDK